jgi:hypothetical protein
MAPTALVPRFRSGTLCTQSVVDLFRGSPPRCRWLHNSNREDTQRIGFDGMGVSRLRCLGSTTSPCAKPMRGAVGRRQRPCYLSGRLRSLPLGVRAWVQALGAQLESPVQLDCYGEISIEFLLCSNHLPRPLEKVLGRERTISPATPTAEPSGIRKALESKNTYGIDVL